MPNLVYNSGGRRPQTPVAAAAYTFRGIFETGDANTFITASVNIGTASADRLVIVGAGCQNSKVLSTVTANAVSLNIDVERHSGALGVSISSGLVTSGSGSQTVTATFSGAAFNQRFMAVWTATGLASNVAKHTQSATRSGGAGGSANIAVDAGDFLFAFGDGVAASPVFTTSTQTPTGTNNLTGSSVDFGSALDWIIASTNASFSIAATGTNDVDWAAASYI